MSTIKTSCVWSLTTMLCPLDDKSLIGLSSTSVNTSSISGHASLLTDTSVVVSIVEIKSAVSIYLVAERGI